MDLSFLIPSKMRRSVLQYFCENADVQVHVRELARQLQTAPQLVYRELINLENWGLLFSFSQGNQRIFTLNTKFACLPAMKELFKAVSEVSNVELTVHQVFDWNKLSKKLDQVKIDPKLAQQLQTKRTQPRAFAEEKMLKKKGLL